MTYEDIACMNPDEMEKAIKELLAIAGVVAILGQVVKISKELANAAGRFL